MKIHALCVVKNESDVIEETLRAAVRWCDAIYVLDNGSWDGTWEKIQSLAHRLPAVTPYRQDSRPFDDGVRGDILRHYLSRARRRDWWCVLDADEFYLDDPRHFLGAVPSHYDAVWLQLYTYLFTEEDLASYADHPPLYDDASRVLERLRHYVVGDYSELRFFRHSCALADIPPVGAQRIYPKRIRLKHFPYRSPQQIQLRLETRREPMRRGEFVHEKRSNWVPGGVLEPGPARLEQIPQSWEERVVASAHCHLDTGDGIYPEPRPWTPPGRPGGAAGLRSWLQSVLSPFMA